MCTLVAESNSYDRKKALVIAVSDYDSSNLKSIEFCKKDGEEIFSVLKELGYEIPDERKLIGYVDSQILKNAVYDFFTNDQNKPDDTLVFYYSGHGVPDKWGMTYLTPSNIDSDRPFMNGFSFDELTGSMLECNSLRVVTILDSCYSGSLKISKGLASKSAEEGATRIANNIVEEKADRLQQGIGRCLLASSQGYEEAYDRQEKDHSIFTYYLLEGLRGGKTAVDDQGNVTYETLGKYIAREIGNLPPDKRPNQTPIRKGDVSGGDIILATYPDKARRQVDITWLIEQGKEYLKNGDFEAAIPFFDNAITANPNSAVAYNYKGDVLFNLDKYEESVKSYDQALKINPNYLEVWKDKGMALERLGKYEEALKCFNSLSEKSPKSETIWYYKGSCLLRLSRFDESIDSFDHALKINPNYNEALKQKVIALDLRAKSIKIPESARDLNLPSIILEGLQYDEKGDFDNAIISFDKAIKIDPNNAFAYNQKGNVLFKLGKSEDAMDTFNLVIKIDPNNAFAYNQKGNVLFKLGKSEDAIQCYERSLQIRPKYLEALRDMGIALQRLGRYDRAVICYNEALNIKPDYLEVLDYRDFCLEKERMKMTDEHTITTDSNADDILKQEQPENTREKDRFQVIRDPLKRLNNIIQKAPNSIDPVKPDKPGSEMLPEKPLDDINTLNRKGMSLFESGENSKALTLFDRALTMDPNNTALLNNKGMALAKLGKYQEALDLYDRALAIDRKYKMAKENRKLALRNLFATLKKEGKI